MRLTLITLKANIFSDFELFLANNSYIRQDVTII